MSTESILSKSTKGVSFLIIQQFFTKMLTFVMNSLLVRYLSPKIFGIMAFLTFLHDTCIFFSREAVRISILRITTSNTGGDDVDGETKEESEKKDILNISNINPDSLQSIVNFSYIPLIIAVPLSSFLFIWQYTKLSSYFKALPHFQTSIFVLWLSIILELGAEFFYNLNQFMLNYKTRSKFEGFSLTIGNFINFITIYLTINSDKFARNVISEEGLAILGFALGKLAFSIILLSLYYMDYMKNFKSHNKFNLRITLIKPQIIDHSSVYESKNKTYYFQQDILNHFKKVYFQMCFKHLLTEGDKLIINSLCSIEEQGIYSLLSNYGSLITRILFQPIEETTRLFLTKLFSSSSSSATQKNFSKHTLTMSFSVVSNIIIFYLYLSILILIFGPINSSYLLRFLIGSKWSSTTILETIRTYCCYLPLLSLNGILEAFFQSVANGDEILRQSYMMMLLSGVFLTNCYVFIKIFKLSLEGLILANGVNMALRILYCTVFISNFYKKKLPSEIASSYNIKTLFHLGNMKGIFLLSFIVWACVYFFVGNFTHNFKQLLINAMFAVILVLVICYNEKTLLIGVIKNKSK
ncbi:hypothetical protein QEN19_001702 [Hanseniaspora menglaensis]